jgi:hypothetical protein
MKISLFSVSARHDYENIIAFTFGDCSKLILKDYVDFVETIEPGRIHILLENRLIITFINGSGVVCLRNNYASISCPKLFQSTEEIKKIKIQTNLLEEYNKSIENEFLRLESKNWVENNPEILKSI